MKQDKQHIAVIDASNATVTIRELPKHLYGAQIEEVEEYFDDILNSDCEFIFGKLTFDTEYLNFDTE